MTTTARPPTRNNADPQLADFAYSIVIRRDSEAQQTELPAKFEKDGLTCEAYPASFAGVLHRPHPKADDIKSAPGHAARLSGSRPGEALVDILGAAYRALGHRLHTYPAHPALLRSFDRSPRLVMHKKPGKFSPTLGETSTLKNVNRAEEGGKKWTMGSRPCAVFEFRGERMDKTNANALLAREAA
jgi:hypothetical protein